jgi:hypothetical protein
MHTSALTRSLAHALARARPRIFTHAHRAAPTGMHLHAASLGARAFLILSSTAFTFARYLPGSPVPRSSHLLPQPVATPSLHFCLSPCRLRTPNSPFALTPRRPSRPLSLSLSLIPSQDTHVDVAAVAALLRDAAAFLAGRAAAAAPPSADHAAVGTSCRVAAAAATGSAAVVCEHALPAQEPAGAFGEELLLTDPYVQFRRGGSESPAGRG